MKTNKVVTKTILWMVLSLCFAHGASADVAAEVEHLQHRWAEINYQLEGKTRLSAFEQLSVEAEQLTQANPQSAEAWIWSGIIKSTYAGAKGGLGALSLAKSSKIDLETALELAPDALQGSAYTSLGALYFNVPGWPIGFGDDKKAEELLLRALELNPAGIDSNYFYGSFLILKKRYADARKYLSIAKLAAPRAGRSLADSVRQEEIKTALAAIANKK